MRAFREVDPLAALDADLASGIGGGDTIAFKYGGAARDRRSVDDYLPL